MIKMIVCPRCGLHGAIIADGQPPFEFNSRLEGLKHVEALRDKGFVVEDDAARISRKIGSIAVMATLAIPTELVISRLEAHNERVLAITRVGHNSDIGAVLGSRVEFLKTDLENGVVPLGFPTIAAVLLQQVEKVERLLATSTNPAHDYLGIILRVERELPVPRPCDIKLTEPSLRDRLPIRVIDVSHTHRPHEQVDKSRKPN